MDLYKYIKQNGIIHTAEVLYQYKLDLFIQLIIGPLIKYKSLQNIIIIESHNDFDCNGGAFYNYLIKNRYNEKYKIIWLLKHPNDAPKQLPHNVEHYPLYRPSILKNYYIWIAKFFVADNTVTRKKRKEQKSFYLTHGVGSIKSVRGKMYMDESLDYILTASSNYAPIMARQVGENFPSKRFISIGFPVHDFIYKENGWNELQKITLKKYKKKLLWMPTFRKGGGYKRIDSSLKMELGIPLIHTMKDFIKLNEYLILHDVLLVIKLHPMQDISDLQIKSLSNIIVLTGITVKTKKIDNYKLITEVDALISDYSSIATEFLHVNRPIAYVFEDEKQFTAGFCVDNIDDLLAGPKLITLNDLYCFIDDVLNEKDPYMKKRDKIRRWMFDYFDANSCERLARFMGL